MQISLATKVLQIIFLLLQEKHKAQAAKSNQQHCLNPFLDAHLVTLNMLLQMSKLVYNNKKVIFKVKKLILSDKTQRSYFADFQHLSTDEHDNVHKMLITIPPHASNINL